MSFYIAIESSCDETSIALLSGEGQGNSFVEYINSFSVIASVISSQIDTHIQYGGVVPEIGARKHAHNIHFVWEELLQKAKLSIPEVSSQWVLSRIKKIFVTTQPGLISALRVGMEFASTISFFAQTEYDNNVEIVPVNHLHGHIASCFYYSRFAEKPDHIPEYKDVFPHLHLLVSGGNTQTILVKNWNDWAVVAKTLDDAAGESYDKIGRMIGLPYPGGVNISKIAQLEDVNIVGLKRSMLRSRTLDFSFSGLKTAARYFVQNGKLNEVEFEKRLSKEQVQKLIDGDINDSTLLTSVYTMSVSVQHIITEQLIRQFGKAIDTYSPKSIGLSGGVSANRLLRKNFAQLAYKKQLPGFFLPHISITGDNAIMIGLAGLATDFKK